VRRLLFCLLFSGVMFASPSAFAQDASSSQAAPAPQDAAAPIEQDALSPEVAKAEAAIVKSDWKTAEPLLDAWLAAHPTDERALFDAGYLADAQGRNDDAVSLYRRAVAADPKSFEAQVSLGLLLARLGKPAEARPALWTATTLDAGAAGPAAKAKAWRALAQIDLQGVDGKQDPSQASIDLLEALKISPETEADTLMAASLAESNGDAAGAEAAYRRALKSDPDSGTAIAGLAHAAYPTKEISRSGRSATGRFEENSGRYSDDRATGRRAGSRGQGGRAAAATAISPEASQRGRDHPHAGGG
jgi:Tfp pilus assembly protein PilF